MFSFGWLLSMELIKRITQWMSFGWWSWLSFILFSPTMIQFHSTVWSILDFSLVPFGSDNEHNWWLMNVVVVRKSSFFLLWKVWRLKDCFGKHFCWRSSSKKQKKMDLSDFFWRVRGSFGGVVLPSNCVGVAC